MNSAVVLALFGLLAVSNAGVLAPAVYSSPVLTAAHPVAYSHPVAYASPALTYAAGPAVVKTVHPAPIAYSHGLVGAPVLTSGHGLVRVARSAEPGVLAAAPIAYASPVAYHHAPAVIAAPTIVRAAPVVHAAPVLAHAPVVHAVPAAVHTRTFHGNTSPIVKTVLL